MGYPTNKEGLRGIARATYHCTVPIEEIAHPFVPPWEDQPPQPSWRQHRMHKLNRALRDGRKLPDPATDDWGGGPPQGSAMEDSIAFDTNMLAKPTPRRLMTLWLAQAGCRTLVLPVCTRN